MFVLFIHLKLLLQIAFVEFKVLSRWPNVYETFFTEPEILVRTIHSPLVPGTVPCT